ncbi:Crp/Fnr family transcriptional regulator [Mycoplana rhizolycopersici]|uniref:Crp/Fnr family transcriptional regulator n=1 Tax=Mycoplana rhizolycopersici TaxID=2746702 RepID=A0ABX2QG20_9HYPH|nr:Crp/Fnr family transcriptional regulator [Rhizobium rhizolycopersici]NVP56158.1 Crp/Fnr family transcriptional regulator [Rhizobium rhizolycopersici]
MTDSNNSDNFCGNKVLSSLHPDAREFMLECGEMRPLETGDVIFREEEAMSHAVFPVEGVISFVTDVTGDKNVEKATLGPEGLLGLAFVLEGDRALGKSVVQVPGKALWLPVEDFRTALDRFHDLRPAILRYVRSLIVQLMESAACNSLHTAEQRVSRWLLQTHDRVAGDQFHITQEAMSKLLALRRATVNVVCTELMEAGAISYNRGRVTVRDRQQLHSRSCSCYDRIRIALKS